MIYPPCKFAFSRDASRKCTWRSGDPAICIRKRSRPEALRHRLTTVLPFSNLYLNNIDICCYEIVQLPFVLTVTIWITLLTNKGIKCHLFFKSESLLDSIKMENEVKSLRF